MRAVIETALSKWPPLYMCDWAVQSDRAGHQKWESIYQHYSDIDLLEFFFFFFQDMIPSWKWTRKDCFSYIALIEGDVKHPIFTVWRLLTSDSDVRSRQTKKERNAKTVAIATHPLSTMRFHRSLGIFVIIFTHFSLISKSILNRFSRNFAGTISWYYGNCPVNMAKFD